MTNVSIHPSTLDGIKRLAKLIKREQGVSHTMALSQAARAAGYENFHHARRHLASPSRAPVGRQLYDLYLTAYWRDGDASGRETLRIQLKESLKSLVPPSLARSFSNYFRIDAEDHLETRDDIRDQAAARRLINEMVRKLAFMAATGLRPATSAQAHAVARRMGELPRRDHQSSWAWPGVKEALCIDEPYMDEDQASALMDSRRVYLDQRGLFIARARWPGLYSPGLTVMYVISGDKEGLSQLMRAIDAIVLCPSEWDWSGVSAPYAPGFVSPARSASGRRKRARLRPIEGGVRRKGALPYQSMPWLGVDWRPERPMAPARHREIGNHLSVLMEIEGLGSANYETFQMARHTLDDWLQREVSSEEWTKQELNAVYYGAHGRGVTRPAGMSPAEAVTRVIDILRGGYVDCVPVRKLIRSLETVLRRWQRKAENRIGSPVI